MKSSNLFKVSLAAFLSSNSAGEKTPEHSVSVARNERSVRHRVIQKNEARQNRRKAFNATVEPAGNYHELIVGGTQATPGQYPYYGKRFV